MVRMRAEFVGPLEGTDEICRQSNHVYASSCVFKMFKKIEKPAACEMQSVLRTTSVYSATFVDTIWGFLRHI
jgi:hypothetical protein